ncbi:MAG: hypothetical protein RI885_875 [Actinomycetota bacterium]
MRFALVCAVVGLGVIFAWGVAWPRSQWFALVGWMHTDPGATEPSAPAYALGRFLSVLGVLGILIVAVNWGMGRLDFSGERSLRPPSVAQEVWGSPTPYVVDRVFSTVPTPPPGLVEMPVDGYQIVDPATGSPDYLYETGRIRVAGLATLPGFLGVPPLAGTVALDTADLVVHVIADSRCIPRQVVVVESGEAVQVGVLFGRPDTAEGPTDDLGDCDPARPTEQSRGYLIPIDVSRSIGDRAVQSLGAAEIELVPPPTP